LRRSTNIPRRNILSRKGGKRKTVLVREVIGKQKKLDNIYEGGSEKWIKMAGKR
jgi:hypothetical protein